MTHVCPIGVTGAVADGELIVDSRWCFDAWADRAAALPDSFPERLWPPPEWVLWSRGRLRIAYAPMDWVNTEAEVALIGITPGRHQAWEAALEAGRALREGADRHEALRRADQAGSFSGPMRRNLVAMLDDIGIADAMGIETSAEFFGIAHGRCGLLSATGFPVFIDGRNYTGFGPSLSTSSVLVALARQMLGGDLTLTPNALLVPLGEAARTAVELLIRDGVVDGRRCLMGVPHPSGANGHRSRQYGERADRLRSEVAEWAQTRVVTPSHRVPAKEEGD